MIKYFRQQSLFIRLGLVFLLTAGMIIISNIYVFNWSYTGRDALLDAHDAYYYNKLVASWGAFPDTLLAKKELNNLKLKCSIFVADNDTSCVNDTLVYWKNHSHPVSLCDYISFSDSENFSKAFDIEFPSYVSFGDISIQEEPVQATFVENENYIYLLTLDLPPVSPPNFIPFVFLALLSLLVLYLVTRRFLYPISLIEKRIISLEAGDLDSELPVVGGDELAVLSQNFNTMVKEIKNLLRQKERLLSDVSHELRSPLAKIRLMLALMPSHKKVQDVDKQIKVLDSLITNILLSDQMSAPYSNLNIKKTTIGHLIKEALALAFVDRVSYEFNDSLDSVVFVDHVKMSIAIKNLLENAHKYALSDEDIKIFIQKKKNFIYLLVKDRGPGIPETLIKDITKAFVRGKNQSKDGFGLGLSICYKVIKAHGGDLIIKNNPNGGASFTLSIPIK